MKSIDPALPDSPIPDFQGTDSDEPDIQHVDYPHLPGWLYGCPACEAMCHCTADSAQCVYEGDHDA